MPIVTCDGPHGLFMKKKGNTEDQVYLPYFIATYVHGVYIHASIYTITHKSQVRYFSKISY